MLVIPQTSSATETIGAHFLEKLHASKRNYCFESKKKKKNHLLKLNSLRLVDSGPDEWLQLPWETVQSEGI